MLRKIYWKEMKDSFRDSRTLLLTVLLPIIMMTGLVFFYEMLMTDSTEGETYRLAISDTASEEQKLIFSPIENIELIETDDVKQKVEEGKAQAAIVFEDNFSENIASQQHTTITVYGDSFSKKSSELMQLVEVALVTMESNIVKERLLAEGIADSMVEPFHLQYEEIAEDEGAAKMLAFLIPMILILAIGIGASPAASDMFAGEKERKTMESLLMTPVNRTTMLVSKGLTITSIGLFIGLLTLIVVTVEIYFFTEQLRAALEAINGIGTVIGISVGIVIIYSVFTASILMITSIIAKTVKEAQSYVTPILLLGMFPAMFMTMIGVNELNMFHFSIPILNMFSIIKELFAGIIDYKHIALFVMTNLIVAIVLFVISRMLFLKDKWVMS
ncbi:sodium transport system permease protein [Gracilibacillus halotolerans]|uniref:Sodium transport system permease protein n=1 Tax=Gracilibacillus halotolerans TaxID=74386 RepID=A0A841RNR5_9BACI|nr:ABC transporter permease [Gracilibacillus halotolerans]MBB6513056.1 sodium transport system permease protein [Gracilibacillus halotolerans]